MKDVISQVHEWIKLVSQVGIGLIALGIVVEIVFGKGAIFGASVVQNLSQIVAEIGGENGFVGLVLLNLKIRLTEMEVTYSSELGAELKLLVVMNALD